MKHTDRPTGRSGNKAVRRTDYWAQDPIEDEGPDITTPRNEPRDSRRLTYFEAVLKRVHKVLKRKKK